ncbi:F-box only protein 15 isoform X2 [Anopheles sinensis]|uniref:F-box only protein 15 isoform X2 n=1 Tax=Anopheles sinensis TaxID=74873 RepID=A0A084WT74_ANOSI|nr:F-box only protein 15 isoform X2 [Anopheles sinensis]
MSDEPPHQHNGRENHKRSIKLREEMKYDPRAIALFHFGHDRGSPFARSRTIGCVLGVENESGHFRAAHIFRQCSARSHIVKAIRAGVWTGLPEDTYSLLGVCWPIVSDLTIVLENAFY